MYSTKDVLLKKLQHYCAYQDRCQFEVEQKLKQLGADQEYADQIFMDLIRDDYLNEERFAKAYARGKFRIHHWGRNKIIAHLKSKFISAPLIKIGILEINEEDYLAELDRQIKKAFQEKKDIHKTIQFLIGKGYESELVFEKTADLKRLLK
ncbi:MAG: RecX family transcriptional regulator [Saprospiraceae bacterium]|nr:RecX family transcriptional regulator [Saprospiraceae bacterium]